MATNLEITGMNAPDISLPNTDKLKSFQNDSNDAEMIVKDILRDIFDTAVKKSEESQSSLDEKKYSSIENIEIEASDLIDLTRNYKQEFGTILRNLKCQSHKTQPSSNTSLENQIKKVIEEIRSLETSVRSNINQEGGDIDVMSEENYKGSKTQINNKSGFTNFLNDCTNGKAPEDVYNDEEIQDEITGQIIDLQVDSESSSFNNQFPSEEELEDIILNDNISSQGDRFNTTVSSKVLSYSAGGESSVQNPVPDPEPDEKLLQPEENSIRRKKSFGSRLMQFFRKNKASLIQRNNNTQ